MNTSPLLSTDSLKDLLVRFLEINYKIKGQDLSPATLYSLPMSDLASARFITECVSEDTLYVPTGLSRGEWYVWDGTIWALDNTGLMSHRLADAYADALNAVVLSVRLALPADVREDKESGWPKALGQVQKYAADLENEKNQSGLRKKLTYMLQKPADFFDHDQQWIVFEDGQVLDTNNLKGGLLPPSPTRAVNRKMGTTLGEGTAENWLKSLKDREIPADQQRYLQVAAGAAMLGRGDAKNIVTLVGVSNTGKSSYIETLITAFGGYASKLPAGAIVAKTSTNFEQHKARGARFIYLEEPYEARTDDSFLKDLSGGGGLVSTQQKGRDVVEWRPQGVLHIGANHVPHINTQDDAIVKRMNIVGFNRKFTPADGVFHKDIHLWLVEQEGPQIARWIYEGALEYDRLGYLPVPASMTESARENVAEASPALLWLKDQFETKRLVDCRTVEETVMPTKMAPADKSLYDSFRAWCFDEGVIKVPMKKTWQKEINYYMDQPHDQKEKRPGGYARLWNVASPNDIEALKLSNVMSINA